MKFIGLLEDYNPQAQYKTVNDGRHKRLIAGFTHTFSSQDLIGLIKRALDAGIIQAPDLPLSALAMAQAAQHKAAMNSLEGMPYDSFVRALNRSTKPVGPFKVVIEGDKLPSRNYICIEDAEAAASKAATLNGKRTMVVEEITRFTIKKEVVKEG